MQSITCGVPHGSVLGTVIFLLYIYDKTESSSLLQFDLFADDTNLFIVISTNILEKFPYRRPFNGKNFMSQY